jgi:intraflagellar transport protein 122
VDFGLWTPEQKQVMKEKVGSKILSAAWSTDGTAFAIGMQSGSVSIRNQKAEETHRIDRRAPVWCLAFIPNFAPPISKGAQGAAGSQSAPPQGVENDVLIIGCWDKTLSFYK